MPVKQMLVNYVPGEECRIAITSDTRLEEFHAEKAGSVTFVGNIYVGRVVNVEPAIQAAFIDFGLESNGFLHISDLHPQYFPGDEDRTEQIGKKTPRRERPPIQHCLKRGQEIIVQVLKEGINTKGPTLTSYLSIPGRYLVMLPDMDRVGVSRRVEDDELRREMKATLDQIELPEGFGFILRTAGIGRGKMELKRDLAYLLRLWKDIERRRKTGSGPRLLYAESDLLMRSLRDFWTADVDEIIVDNEAAIRRAAKFMKIVSPRSGTRLLHYNRGAPLFHAFGIEDQIAQMHAREVPLPSGGYLVIDETEAMIAIDVNSGKMRNTGDAETTAYRTNKEAVDEICRQLRLRDVGGLVLCDLIDMMKRDHRRDIENRFKENLKSDRAATKVLPISQFGIVEMTRQRQRGSLRSVHFGKCPSCHGRGLLQRPESVASDAIRSLAALLDQEKVTKVEMVVAPSVAGALLSSKRQALGRMEYQSKKHVDVRISDDVGLDRVVFYAYDAAGADLEVDKLPRIKPPKDLPVWEDLSGEAQGDDWSVDTTHEQTLVPEQTFTETEVELSDDAPMLVDLTEEDLAEAEQVQSGKARLAPAGHGHAPPADAGEGRGGKRRRRRGRGRGKEGGEPSRAPQPPPKHQRPAPAGVPAVPAPTAPSPADRRGDSWDIAPSELASMQRDHAIGAPAEGAEPMPADDGTMPMPADGAPAVPMQAGQPGEAGAGKKRRRGRRGGRRRRKGGREGTPEGAGAGEVPYSRHPEATSHAPAEQPGDVPDAGGHAEEPSGEPDDLHDQSDGPPSSDGRPISEAGGPQPGEGGKKRRRRRRRGKGGRDGAGEGGSPAPFSATAPAPPAPEHVPAPRPQPPAAAPAPARPAFRTLYGNRRRLAPGDIARVKREE